MFNFIRKIPYYQELRDILAEEDEILTEWKNVHLNATKKQIQEPGGPFVFSGVEYREVTDLEFERLWKTLAYMHRESRKLEEIKRLLDVEEQSLSSRDRRILNQLRGSLDWKPLKLKKKEECYIGKTGYFEGRFDREKYKYLMAEFVYDEITLWEYLNNEKNRIKRNVVERMEEFDKIIQEAQLITRLISRGDPSWTDKLERFYLKITRKEVSSRLLDDENKRFWIHILSDIMASHEKDISFLRRALEILKDVENRLNRCKP